MAGLAFDTTFNSEPVTKGLEKIQKGIYETAKAAELSGGRIDAAFNRISLKGLERIYELMQGFPKEIQGIESFKKQMADLEKRLEQANKKIVELQNQAKQSITVRTNASEVSKETFAYDSLLESLNDILGARGQNVAAMLREQNAIKLNQRELKVLEDVENRGLKLSDAQQTRRIQLTNSIMQHKQAISSLQQVINNEVKLEQVAVGSMAEMSQSLGRMRMAYRQLTEDERNSKFGQDLLSSIQQADAKIKELDASIGNHQRNVGDYSKQWNGLQYQMQMVAREMPNFAISPQTGIISLTNNLPYLVDELKKAKDAHKAYIAEVKAGNTDLKEVPSVGKLILSSLFNWQTALIMGITLITTYRKEISEWVGELFNAKDTIKSLKDAESDINEKFIDNTKNVGQQIVKLRELQEKWKSLGSDINAQKKFIQDAKSDFDNLGASVYTVSDAESLLIKNTPAFIEALKLRAQAAAAKELSEEKYKEYLSKRQKAFDESQKEPSISDNLKRIAYNLFEPSTSGVINTKEQEDVLKSFQGQRIKSLMDEAEAAKVDAESYFTLKQAKEEAATEKINSILPNSKAEIQNKDFWTNQKNNAIVALDAIDSKQKTILDNAAKEPKKDLYSLGIDKSIVDSYKSAVEAKKEAEKELKAYPSTSDTTKQESAAEKLRKEQEKYNLLLDKQKLEQSRFEQDSQNQVNQARINAMREGSVRTLAQMKLDHSKEMQQLERQQEDLLRKKIEDEKAEFDAKEDEKKAKDPKHVKQTFDSSKITLSQSEKDVFSNQRMYLSIQQAGETQALLDKERQSWNEYLSEYGTFQEKKDAITAEYNAKISLADTKGEKESLKKEMENRIKEVNLDELKASINFADIFGDLDSQSTEALTKMRDKLKEVIEQSAKDLKPADLKTLQDAFKDIDLKIAERNPFGELKQGAKEYKASTQAVIQAQEDLNTVMQGGEVIIGTYIDSAGKICAKLLTQEQAEKKLATAQSNRQTTLSNLTQAANSIGSKGMEVVNAGNEIVGMLENFGVKVPEAVSQTLNGIGQVMSGLESIDITKPFSAVTGAISVLTGVGNTIAGLLGFGGADYSGYNEMVSQYELLSDTWDELIDKKREYIDISYGAEALKSGEEALAIIDKSQDAQRNLAKARATSGDSAGSHSIAYRQNNNLGNYASELYKYVAQNGNYNDITNALLGATEEQLKKVAEQMPELWAGLDGNFREHLNNIISGAKQTKEVLAQMKEAVTGISLDEFSGGYIDMLSDLDSTNEDFADNFEKYLQKAIFQSLIANKYKSDIEGLYNSWDELGKDGLTNEEAEDLRKKQQELTDNMLADRDKLMNDFGWQSESTSQEATNGGFQTMSQDTGSELNGRFTALQISNEEIKNSMLAMLTGVNLISTTTVSNGITLMEIKNVALMSNSHLEDIAGFQKRIITNLDTKLANIERSTKIMAGS